MKNKSKPGQIAFNEISSGDFWARATIEWNGPGMASIEKRTKVEINKILQQTGMLLYNLVKEMRGEN